MTANRLPPKGARLGASALVPHASSERSCWRLEELVVTHKDHSNQAQLHILPYNVSTVAPTMQSEPTTTIKDNKTSNLLEKQTGLTAKLIKKLGYLAPSFKIKQKSFMVNI